VASKTNEAKHGSSIPSVKIIVVSRPPSPRKSCPPRRGNRSVAVIGTAPILSRKPTARIGTHPELFPDVAGCSSGFALPATSDRWPAAEVVIIDGVSEASGLRIAVAGELAGLRSEVQSRALELGLSGWVRLADEDARLLVHAEGPAAALDKLVAWLAGLRDAASVDVSPADVEGHEQFAVRGVPAGVFVVQEHQATAHHFDLRLEVGGVMRSWAIPKGPSLDPAVKRFAVQVEDLEHNGFEDRTGGGGVILWDRGSYEQRGRVPWPEALERGHAVFVLHGSKLRGGFALQRTREARSRSGYSSNGATKKPGQDRTSSPSGRRRSSVP
jgi:DNA ligase D-like protein (predicted 3'-phosphoesterase)